MRDLLLPSDDPDDILAIDTCKNCGEPIYLPGYRPEWFHNATYVTQCHWGKEGAAAFGMLAEPREHEQEVLV